MIWMRIMIFSVVAAVTVSTLTGCDDGPKLGQVSGTVTMNGEKKGGIIVELIPLNPANPEFAVSATGGVRPDGTYEIRYVGGKKGAPLGEYRVVFSAADLDGGEAIRIPDEFTRSKSQETRTVVAGKNTFDFDLK